MVNGVNIAHLLTAYRDPILGEPPWYLWIRYKKSEEDKQQLVGSRFSIQKPPPMLLHPLAADMVMMLANIDLYQAATANVFMFDCIAFSLRIL